jgi:hypothetical protein
VNAEQWASEYAARVICAGRMRPGLLSKAAYRGWKLAMWDECLPYLRGSQVVAGWLAYQIARAWHPHTWVTHSEGADVRSDGSKP